jgi:hypothetical protein
VAASLSGLLGLGLLVGSGIWLAHRSADPSRASASHEAVEAGSTASIAPPSEAPLPPTMVAATLDAAPSANATSSSTAPAATAEAQSGAATAGSAQHHEASSSTAASSAHSLALGPSTDIRTPVVDCSTPFTIDPRGHHVPKPECL